jgi:hypothetical protein
MKRIEITTTPKSNHKQVPSTCDATALFGKVRMGKPPTIFPLKTKKSKKCFEGNKKIIYLRRRKENESEYLFKRKLKSTPYN